MAAARDVGKPRNAREEAQILATTLQGILTTHKFLTPAKREVLTKLLDYLNSIKERWASTDIRRINDAKRIINNISQLDLLFLSYTVTNALLISEPNSELRDKVGKEASIHLIKYLAGLAELILLYMSFNSAKNDEFTEATKLLVYSFVADQLSQLTQNAVSNLTNLQTGLQVLLTKLGNMSIDRIPKMAINHCLTELVAIFQQAPSAKSAFLSYLTQKTKSIGSNVAGVITSIPKNLLYSLFYSGKTTPKIEEVDEKKVTPPTAALFSPASAQSAVPATRVSSPVQLGAVHLPPGFAGVGAVHLPPDFAEAISEAKGYSGKNYSEIQAETRNGLNILIDRFKAFLEALPKEERRFSKTPYPYVSECLTTLNTLKNKYQKNHSLDDSTQQLLLLILNFKEKSPEVVQIDLSKFLSQYAINLYPRLKIVSNTVNDPELFNDQHSLFKNALMKLSENEVQIRPAAAAARK